MLTDLKWWGKGTFVQFVTWVTEMGYPFTMDNLKKIRREVGAELSRWRSLPPSSNQHVAVAWELYNLFMNPSVPGNVMTYETGYIDHTTLTDELLGRTPTRKTGDKSLRIHIDSTIHAKVPHYAKHKHHRESFAMASAVSRLMVSIGCEADTRPGLSLAAHTIATTHVIAATTRTATIPTMRTRSAHSLPRGYRLR